MATRREGRRYTLYTALIAGGMMLFIYLLLGLWPFGDGTIVTGDLGGLYLNYYAHLKRALLGDAGFVYGFDKGLGGNLLGLYAYYYASPFFLLYLLFPLRWFPVAASVVLFAKIVLASVFFRVYTAAKYPKLGWRSVPMALCYGFIAYNFAYAQNIMWHDIMLFLPLICLGIDRIAAGRSFLPYAAVLAFAIFSNFYIAFMACIFAVLYFFYTMLLRDAALAQEVGWKWPILRLFGGSALAGGLCAALLLPALFNINQNKGGLLDFRFSFEPLFPLSRLPERFVWGSFAPSDAEGHLPFVYCGALALVLVVSYFASKAIKLREKLLSGGVILFFLLSFWLKGLDTIWHGLKEPIWFPARYSFIFCFFVLALCARALAARAAGKYDVIFSGGVVFLALLAVAAFPVAVSRSRTLLTALCALALAFFLVLAATATSLRRRHLVYGVITCIVAVDVAMNAYYISAGFDRYPLSVFQARVDGAGGTISAIKTADDGDYRIAENHFSNLNDPMLYGYRGLSHFGSTQDGYAQGVLYNLGFRAYEGAGPYLSGGTAFADSVLGLRYLSDGGDLAVPGHWRPAAIEAPNDVYINSAALPMLFTFDPARMTDTRHGEYEPDLFAYQNDFFAELGGEGAMLEPVDTLQMLDAGGAARGRTGPYGPGFYYTFTAREAGVHYAWFEAKTMLLPTYINNVEKDVYFAPHAKGVVELGRLAAGQTVTIAWPAPEEFEITEARAVRLNEEKLRELVDFAVEGQGGFTVADGLVTGSVAAEEGRTMLYTSIPWDGGWRATVNGENTAIRRFMGGLLAVELIPGENTVRLEYVPEGAGAGWAITGVCALALAVLAALSVVRRRRLRAADNESATGNMAENAQNAAY